MPRKRRKNYQEDMRDFSDNDIKVTLNTSKTSEIYVKVTLNTSKTSEIYVKMTKTLEIYVKIVIILLL
jgi:hypothetical protein